MDETVGAAAQAGRAGTDRAVSKTLFAAALAAMVPSLAAVPALAHPHVFVVAKEQVMFGRDGKVTGIRAAWTFDDMYSAFVTQGIGQPDEVLTDAQMAPLAKTNVESLAEFGYFTVAKAGGHPLEFTEPVDYSLHETPDKLVTLTFTLPLKVPASAGQAFSLSVYDPTYFVAFEFDNKEPFSLAQAPPGCSGRLFKPKPLDATENQKLSESFFSNLSPGADFGIKLATRVIIACP